MATLYQLTDDYLTLLEMAEDPDMDEQALMDTMEGIDGAFEDKADGYARVMAEIEGRMDVIEMQEKRLANRRKTLLKNYRRMKAALQDAMKATGKTKFKTDLFSFSVRKNPPSVVIDNMTCVPSEYLVPQDPVVDKKAVIQMLKNIDEPCSWAHLEQTERLQIS